MKSKVYFTAVKDNDDEKTVGVKLGKLLEQSNVLDCVEKGQRVAAKIHFGEEGSTGFVDPRYARVICDGIALRGAKAFLADANTLYRGRRTNAKDHIQQAWDHGFTREATGADIVVPDDTVRENTADVLINKKFVRTAKVARVFTEADALVAITHFKGHMITGFGGALKNLGMGCATREGKLMQHNDVTPVFSGDKCIGCGECVKICPVAAVRVENGKCALTESLCIGCGSCVGACPTMALFVDLAAGDKCQLKMVEYAYAALRGKERRSGFINFAVKINQECDCWGEFNPRIAPDVGILASNDPVSIDKASMDLVNAACGRDIFREVHPDQNGMKGLEYAHVLGMGNLEYELIEV